MKRKQYASITHSSVGTMCTDGSGFMRYMSLANENHDLRKLHGLIRNDQSKAALLFTERTAASKPESRLQASKNTERRGNTAYSTAKLKMRKETYQSADTSTWAVVRDNPKLTVDRKSIVDDVNVLVLALLELLQDSDLVDEVFEVFVLLAGIDFVIGRIDIDDLESDDLIRLGVTAAES